VPPSSLTRAVFLVLLAGALAAVAGTVAPSADASPRLRVGVVENAWALNGDPQFFPLARDARVQVLRLNLNWGGPLGVARHRPQDPRNPADRAYDFFRYDRAVLGAQRHGIAVVFTIFGTPRWANGNRNPNVAPRNAADLRNFAYAAAVRYSGEYRRVDGVVLPRVRMWTAWNEPNLRIGLVPQYRKVGKKKWVIQSARDYARICNAIYDGIHATGPGNQVACGVTAPRGNNNPSLHRSSISPLVFLRAMKKAGVRNFDAYAHHPYYGHPSESPSTMPRGPRAVGLANIDVLVREVTRLYGPKRIWLTEYGYQTNPPDRIFGVSWNRQAQYLTQAVAIARRHPRIDLLLWHLMRDEARKDGWQSGLVTAKNQKKPAFFAFQRAAR
jgi:hypothetical protein